MAALLRLYLFVFLLGIGAQTEGTRGARPEAPFYSSWTSFYFVSPLSDSLLRATEGESTDTIGKKKIIINVSSSSPHTAADNQMPVSAVRSAIESREPVEKYTSEIIVIKMEERNRKKKKLPASSRQQWCAKDADETSFSFLFAQFSVSRQQQQQQQGTVSCGRSRRGNDEDKTLCEWNKESNNNKKSTKVRTT
eukprot:gene4645-3348_t